MIYEVIYNQYEMSLSELVIETYNVILYLFHIYDIYACKRMCGQVLDRQTMRY